MLDAHFLCSELVESLAVSLPLTVGRPSVMVLREQHPGSPTCTARAGEIARHHRKGRHHRKRERRQPLDLIPLLLTDLFKAKSAPLYSVLSNKNRYLRALLLCWACWVWRFLFLSSGGPGGMVTHFGLYPGLYKGITVPLQNKAPSREKREEEQPTLPLFI